MRPADFSKWFGYTVAGVTISAGLVLLAGFVLSEWVPDKVRLTFGSVLMLLGIYRGILTKIRASQRNSFYG